ncbi:MAG: hypothetical protein AAFN05_14845 [Pseudomonadota bacterium]
MRLRAIISLAFHVLSLGVLLAGPAHAQSPAHLAGAATTGGEGGAAPALPTTLTPALVDALMSELSDEQVRQLLREELQRQAAEQAAAEDDKMDSYAEVVARLDGMFITIGERTARWWVALGNLAERQATVEERLASGSLGPWGIVGALISVPALTIAAIVLAQDKRTRPIAVILSRDGRPMG